MALQYRFRSSFNITVTEQQKLSLARHHYAHLLLINAILRSMTADPQYGQ